MEPEWLIEFKSNSRYRIEESVRMLRKALDQLPEHRFWQRPNPASNAPGHLLLHLSGNMRQYVVSGLGGAEDTRVRTREFEPVSKPAQDEVWNRFSATVSEVIKTLEQAGPDAYLEYKTVQGFRMSGMGMVLHAVEHLSYHTGQIAYAVKAWENKDLGFYDGTDLNITNT